MKELENLKYEDYALQDTICFNSLKVGDLIYNDVQDKFMKIVGIFKEGSLMRITFLDKKDIPLIKDVRVNRTLESIGIALCKSRVLDSVEREYLKNFLKPYMKEYDITIRKILGFTQNQAQLQIDILDKSEEYFKISSLKLPYFDVNRMYKKMEADKIYDYKEIIW